MKEELEINNGALSLSFFADEKLFLKVAENQKLLSLLKSLSEAFEQHYLEFKLRPGVKMNFNLELVDANRIQGINKEHRAMDKATDVLSFGLYENFIQEHTHENLPFFELGDVLICDEVCQKQAVLHTIDYADEFIHLCVHGLLHLLGFDHERGVTEDQIMRRYESRIIDSLQPSK